MEEGGGKRKVSEEPETEEAVTDYTSINSSGSCSSCNRCFSSRGTYRAFSECGCAQECLECVELYWARLLRLETLSTSKDFVKRCRTCHNELTKVPERLPNKLPVEVFVNHGQYTKLVKKPR